MLRNHLLLAVRNLFKRKLFSFINIFGLAIGIAVCLVILRYVDLELSYDSFHKNADRIYRTITASYRNGEHRGTGILSGFAQGPALLNDVPEVEAYVRTHPMYGGAVFSYQPSIGDAVTFHEEDIQWVDSTFFNVFSFRALQGDLSTALDNPNAVVVTEETARKYFADDDPIGKILKVAGGWSDGDFEVTAVLENVPSNSHFQFDFLLPMNKLLQAEQYRRDDGWGWNNFVTYVMLHPGTDVRAVEEKMPAFIEKYRGEDLARSNSTNELTFQPIREIHLTPGLEFEFSQTVSKSTIYFFVLISLFIMAIAWVNYINLSTARAEERSREVGIKKTVGALRRQLIGQFILESMVINLLGMAIAVGLAVLLLPVLGDIVGKDLVFDFSDTRFWIILLGLFAIGSLVSGAYPAFVLSSFKVTRVLKGRPDRMTGGYSLRKMLVVFQFASSLILIAGTFAVYRQLTYMRTEDKGLITERMLVIDGPSVIDRDVARQRLTTYKNELGQIPGVIQVATSAAIPGGGFNWGTGVRRDGTEREESKSGSIVWVDPDFVDTYGMTLLSGRSFNPAIKSDMESVLINEAAVSAYGLGDNEKALSERLIIGGDTTAILGVLKNYNWNSLKMEHTPFMLKTDTIMGRNFSIHLSGERIPEVMRQVAEKYAETFPGNPFNYYFLDDFFDKQYKDDQQFGKLFTFFSVLAIVIACLGLWGLAAFTTTQRLKEIGIRKVLGASVSNITSLLSWQFFKLVLIAAALALPVTWYGIDRWLNTFAFRIGLHWDLFVIPVVILAILALGTVSVQIIRGATTSPAQTLRTE